MSKNSGRKHNVMLDELEYKKSDCGLYAVLPFSQLKTSPSMRGDNRRAVFKLKNLGY